ncbi:MAG: GspH/FimT family pseudopilin [Aquisalimonadaceae bacterium]
MDRNTANGFTLIELVVVIALVAGLATTAVAGMRGLFQNQAAYSANRLLIASLNLARTHAVANRQVVAVCRSGTGHSCDTEASWDGGWLVFETPANDTRCSDPNGTGFCAEHGGRILQVERHAAAGQLWITHNHNVRHRVRFNALGLSPGYTGRFTVCAADGSSLRGIVIPQTGRIRAARPSEFLDCET